MKIKCAKEAANSVLKMLLIIVGLMSFLGGVIFGLGCVTNYFFKDGGVIGVFLAITIGIIASTFFDEYQRCVEKCKENE